MTQILFSLMMVSMVFNMFVRARASTMRIGEVFTQENAMSWKVTGGEVAAAEGSVVEGVAARDVAAGSIAAEGRVEFDQVDFTYANAGGSPVLKNVTFSCEPGETVGIIGSTGSGKSSLVGLIPRFYDATAGR